MTRCPACGTHRIVATVGLDPRGLCTACGTRWSAGPGVGAGDRDLARAPDLRVVRDGPRRYRLIGELDLATASQLREAVAADLTVPTQLSLDLRELAFVDGAGVRSLTSLDEALGGALRLLAPNRQTRRVIDLSAPPRLHVLG